PIGAIPGAIPPMSGWTAASGELELGAWVLFVIMFAWQHPHFYAIAWMYKKDYAEAGYKMLPMVDPSGNRMCAQILLYSVLLILISIVPSGIGETGVLYLAGASVLGAGMLTVGLSMANTKTYRDARMLLRASVIYLPLLLVLIVVDGII
ncbi:MAG: protoheme IX farnesyltransferase, partial [Verrucomicrobiota bacterium]